MRAAPLLARARARARSLIALATLTAAAAATLAACAAEPPATSPDASTATDADPDAPTCPRPLAPADRTRKVVVSLPYDSAGHQAPTWALWSLDTAGTLTDTGTRFTMGRATTGEVAFTPDGAIGLAVQDDGSLGVFRVDGDAVTVVHARFEGSFYAGHVVIADDGAAALVVDGNWANNGGGLYRVDIGCDGTLTDRGRWLPGKLAAGLHVLGTRALVPAAEFGDGSPPGADVHLLDLTREPPARIASVDAFGDDDAIVAGSAVTHDGRFALVGDNSEFSGVPNRVAVVGVAANGASLTAQDVLTPVEDPIAIVTSPFDDAALVVSGYGDAIYALDYAPAAATPFTRLRALTYTGARPQLPGDAVAITRGALRGLVVVVENTGLRRVRFAGGGVVNDLGKTSTGTGVAAIPGALGIQP